VSRVRAEVAGMGGRTVRYCDLFALFLQGQHPLMFRAFLSACSPFVCERCHTAFGVSESGVEEDDPVLCPRCAAKDSGRQR
jgi:hypothetical protein